MGQNCQLDGVSQSTVLYQSSSGSTILRPKYGIDESGCFLKEKSYIVGCEADSELNGSQPPLPKLRSTLFKQDERQHPNGIYITHLNFRYTVVTPQHLQSVQKWLYERQQTSQQDSLANANPYDVTWIIGVCNVVKALGREDADIIMDAFSNPDNVKSWMATLMQELFMLNIPAESLRMEVEADENFYPVNEADRMGYMIRMSDLARKRKIKIKRGRNRIPPEYFTDFADHFVPFQIGLHPI
ncbi:MAG: hypothetical protein HYW26_00070 [Candidatus Aenigmarchaeota archaeon]|nr:hypothetical protein [Candidatus Aenigmarchaeota archaeon]